MIRGRESVVEAGCIGGCLGLLAGPASIVLFFVLAVLGIALGFEAPVDGNTGLGFLALPLSAVGVVLVAYYLAAHGGGHKFVAVVSAVLGFCGFFVGLILAATYLD